MLHIFTPKKVRRGAAGRQARADRCLPPPLSPPPSPFCMLGPRCAPSPRSPHPTAPRPRPLPPQPAPPPAPVKKSDPKYKEALPLIGAVVLVVAGVTYVVKEKLWEKVPKFWKKKA